MGEEIFKLLSIAIGRIILGGLGFVFRWIYYKVFRKKKKLSIDDYENKIVAFIVLLVFFVALYLNLIN
jgi:Trk-type K+ transport system membrane component